MGACRCIRELSILAITLRQLTIYNDQACGCDYHLQKSRMDAQPNTLRVIKSWFYFTRHATKPIAAGQSLVYFSFSTLHHIHHHRDMQRRYVAKTHLWFCVFPSFNHVHSSRSNESVPHTIYSKAQESLLPIIFKPTTWHQHRRGNGLLKRVVGLYQVPYRNSARCRYKEPKILRLIFQSRVEENSDGEEKRTSSSPGWSHDQYLWGLPGMMLLSIASFGVEFPFVRLIRVHTANLLSNQVFYSGDSLTMISGQRDINLTFHA